MYAFLKRLNECVLSGRVAQGRRIEPLFNPLHPSPATLLFSSSYACMAVVVLIPNCDSLVDP